MTGGGGSSRAQGMQDLMLPYWSEGCLQRAFVRPSLCVFFRDLHLGRFCGHFGGKCTQVFPISSQSRGRTGTCYWRPLPEFATCSDRNQKCAISAPDSHDIVFTKMMEPNGAATTVEVMYKFYVEYV